MFPNVFWEMQDFKMNDAAMSSSQIIFEKSLWIQIVYYWYGTWLNIFFLNFFKLCNISVGYQFGKQPLHVFETPCSLSAFFIEFELVR